MDKFVKGYAEDAAVDIILDDVIILGLVVGLMRKF